MPVVHVIERVNPDRADQKVEAVDISSGHIAKDIGLQDHLVVFVEIVGRSSVYGFNDAPSVAVVGVFDHGAILGLGVEKNYMISMIDMSSCENYSNSYSGKIFEKFPVSGS